MSSDGGNRSGGSRRSGRGRGRRKTSSRGRQRQETKAPRIDMRELVDEDVWDLRGRLVEIRRDLHRHPELGFEETRTAEVIADYLDELDIEITRGVAKTGVVGLLEGGRPGPVVMYRADMDALPIQEVPKGDYTSRRDGVMHACGHDGHVAIALGVASVLAARRDDLTGTVKFVFQPAEEGLGGAREMVKGGVLGNPRVDAAFGLHLWNSLPSGTVGLAEGPIMAGSAEFRVRVQARGGHGAAPHLTADPVVAASFLVTALQSIVSRQTDPLEQVILSVGAVRGGERENIIPSEVCLEGTVRSFDEGVLKEILRRIEQMSKGVCQGFGATCKVETSHGYPVTVNDTALVGRVREAVKAVLGGRALQPARVMGSEDMAYYLREVPGCYLMLGSRNDAKGCNAPHHSPEFDFDEDVLPLGVQLGCSVVEEFLREKGDSRRSRKSRAAREEEPEEILEETGEIEEEEESEEALYSSSRDREAEEDFLRTRKRRRRRGASRERREALLPEHLGPRARDAEREARREILEADVEAEADLEEEDERTPTPRRGHLHESEAAERPPRRGRREEEPGREERTGEEAGEVEEPPEVAAAAGEEEEAPARRRRSMDRRRRRRAAGPEEDLPEAEQSVAEADEEPEEEPSTFAAGEEHAEEESGPVAEEPRPAQLARPKRQLLAARGAGVLEEDDLTPAHKKGLLSRGEDEADAGEEKKKPRTMGAAPWLSKKRKSRR